MTSTVDKNGNTMLFTTRAQEQTTRRRSSCATSPTRSPQTITIGLLGQGRDFECINDTSWTRASGTGLTNPKIIDHVKTIKDISGRTLYFTYTDKGLLGELIDGYGSTDGTPKTHKFQYDMTQGNKNVKLVKVTDPRGNATNLVYNYPSAGDDPQWPGHQVVPPTGWGANPVRVQPTRTARRAPHQHRRHRAQNNKATYQHDGFRARYQVTNAKNEVTKRPGRPAQRDLADRGHGAVSTFKYDAKTGYPTEKKDALAVKNATAGTVLTYATQLNGYVADVATKTSPEGRRHAFTYTTEGDLATVTDPTGAVTTNTYDTWGRLLTAKDANGNVTTYGDYHPSGYPRTITDPLNAKTTSVYDARGNVTEMNNAKEAKTTQGYDTFGRPKGRVEPVDAAKSRYLNVKASVYDANDNIVTAYAANGTATTSVYDKADQVTETVLPKDESADPERKSTVTYDKVRNILTETEPQGN